MENPLGLGRARTTVNAGSLKPQTCRDGRGPDRVIAFDYLLDAFDARSDSLMGALRCKALTR
jgi:hypothetical protein